MKAHLEGVCVVDYTAENVKELSALLGDEPAAEDLLLIWCDSAEKYADAASDAFVSPKERTRTDGARLKQMQAAVRHMDALIPLLDDRLSWMTAAYMPGFTDGPETSWQNDDRVASLSASLSALRTDVARAVEKLPPVQAGRPLELTPRMLLTISLIAWLKDAGVPMATGERSKMVQAIRVCWDIAGFEGDPRDVLRSLQSRITKKTVAKNRGA